VTYWLTYVHAIRNQKLRSDSNQPHSHKMCVCVYVCVNRSEPVSAMAEFILSVHKPNSSVRNWSFLCEWCPLRIYKTIILPAALYGCETWSLTLRGGHRLSVFENRVLRIFESKKTTY
jgi:hypothetical protein